MSAGVSDKPVKQEKPDCEAIAGDGDADNLLDAILRNALGTSDDSVKKDGAKSEGTKKEGVKGERVKGEHPIKQEKCLALKGEAAKGDPAKGENAKGEKPKGEGAKTEGAKLEGVKRQDVKGEVGIKGEKGIKLEAAAIAPIDKRDKKNKKRSRSGKRKKKRSRSKSRKRRRRSSSSSRSESKSPVAAALEGLPQARVVAVRGHWAQYLSPAGETFYKNVLSGEVQWQKPTNFDCVPSRRAGEMTPGPGEAACYIFHMPPEWSEADLMQLFSPFGQVTSAHVQRDANGFSRSCGFVTYATQDGASEACNMMNGFGVDGKFLKVSLTQFSLGAGAPGGPGAAPGPGGLPAPSGVPAPGGPALTNASPMQTGGMNTRLPGL